MYSMLLNVGYTGDLLSGRLIFTGYSQLAITDAYVSKYITDLNHSFIYLGACSTGKDPGLARSFLNKGAAAVVANDESIITKYNCKMMIDIVNGLLKQDESTNMYYTLSQALEFAKRKNGDDDGSAEHAKPVIFGDEGYRLKENYTEDNPYIINSVSELESIRNDLSGHYALGKDII